MIEIQFNDPHIYLGAYVCEEDIVNGKKIIYLGRGVEEQSALNYDGSNILDDIFEENITYILVHETTHIVIWKQTQNYDIVKKLDLIDSLQKKLLS